MSKGKASKSGMTVRLTHYLSSGLASAQDLHHFLLCTVPQQHDFTLLIWNGSLSSKPFRPRLICTWAALPLDASWVVGSSLPDHCMYRLFVQTSKFLWHPKPFHPLCTLKPSCDDLGCRTCDGCGHASPGNPGILVRSGKGNSHHIVCEYTATQWVWHCRKTQVDLLSTNTYLHFYSKFSVWGVPYITYSASLPT